MFLRTTWIGCGLSEGGEEQALAPHEECYHRLLAFGLDEANDLAEAYVKTNSLPSLYESVLIPTVTLAEMGAQRDELDAEHVMEGIKRSDSVGPPSALVA